MYILQEKIRLETHLKSSYEFHNHPILKYSKNIIKLYFYQTMKFNIMILSILRNDKPDESH